MRSKKLITAKNMPSIILSLCMVILSLAFVLPLCLVVSTSLATGEGLASYGYSFFPKSFTLDAYKYVFRNPTQLINSYIVTIAVCLVTIPSQLFLNGMAAYALMRAPWGYKLLKYVYISSFFGGGMIPTYIWYTQYLHLSDNFLVYVLPGIYTCTYIMMMRTFFQNTPKGMMRKIWK